jgi:hypothetical protein
MKSYIEVIETASGEIVRTIDVTGSTPRRVEKIENGLLMSMDLSNYHTNIVGVDFPEPSYSDVWGLGSKTSDDFIDFDYYHH